MNKKLMAKIYMAKVLFFDKNIFSVGKLNLMSA